MSGLTQLLNTVGRLGAVITVGGVVVNTALYNVEAGHSAVIYDRFRGVLDQTTGEGTHFIIPWVQRPVIFDCRTKPRSISTFTGTKDLQNVNITLRILYRPKNSSLPRIYKEIGQDYDERVLPSIGNEVLKSIVAQFDAGELITQRESVSQRIRQTLLKRSAEFDIVLDDISITHLTFGKEFAQAVELKQVEQQKAERARFVVEKAEQEQLAEVIRAEGDSEAARLISKSLAANGPGLVELRKIDAAVDIAQTLSRSRGVTYLPGGGNMLLNLGA